MRYTFFQEMTGIKKSRFPLSLFAIYLGVLLLMAGIHTGLIVMVNAAQWNTWI